MHFFSRLLAEADESVYSQVHAAPANVAPFQVATWRRANPGLAFGLPAPEVLKAEARLAKRDAAELATFRALRLNQGTDEVETTHLISAEVWREVETETLPPALGPMALGVDLGGTAAFTAAAAYWPKTGRLEGFVACGSSPPLPERALADGASGVYEATQRAGELVLIGNRVVPVGPLAEAVRRYGVPQAMELTSSFTQNCHKASPAR